MVLRLGRCPPARRAFDSRAVGRRPGASLPVGRRVEWSRARSRKNGPSTRSLRSLAQDIRLAWIWPKAMSEPAGRQASRMAGGGGFEPPLTGSEPVVLPLDDPPAGPSSIISDEG